MATAINIRISINHLRLSFVAQLWLGSGACPAHLRSAWPAENGATGGSPGLGATSLWATWEQAGPFDRRCVNATGNESVGVA